MHTLRKHIVAKRLIILIQFLLYPIWIFATHNRGGEITYKHLNSNTYEFTITTYTDISNPNNADRQRLGISYSDNTFDTFPRVGISTISAGVQENIYRGIKTFPGPGNYRISVEDPNRNGGVINIPNSLFTVFFIETTISINPFLGINNSVQLLSKPIDRACLNRLYVHNPAAYDVDGDSLSYELIPCRGQNGQPIPGYTIPDATISISINPITGEFLWENPRTIGEYNIAILIREWRAGIQIGSVIRDMQIVVAPCSNNPPIITPMRDTCIWVGQTLFSTITANDQDNDNITLTGNGEPLLLIPDSAIFNQPTTGRGTVSSNFVWQPGCNAVRRQPYQMVFRAVDNNINQLADMETWRIKVISPPVQNLSANSFRGRITLNWNASFCGNAKGYLVYRKVMPSGWNPDSCETGVPASLGFTLIETIMGRNSTTFIDDNNGDGLPAGVEFCYRITAFFSNFPTIEATYAESIASDEICEIVKRDLPVLTNVDVMQTSTADGAIKIVWAKPTQLDTIQFPGPYKYELRRFNNLQGTGSSNLIYELTTTNLFQLADTTFLDVGLNTVDNAYSYKINMFFEKDTLLGISPTSSSVYTRVLPAPTALKIEWNYNTNWINDSFAVFRQDLQTMVFNKIATTNTNQFLDSNLLNGQEYCYYVMSYGSFADPSLPNPTKNKSQQVCGIPKDTIPPCPPVLKADNKCDLFLNELSWIIDANCSADLKSFKIYYKPNLRAPFELLAEVDRNILNFEHRLQLSLAGCYYITAIDSSLNESKPSNEICLNNCSVYELPNVFTPNGDGINDLLVPIKVKFIEKVDFKLYNRWGQLVFETTNPQIEWDGIIKSTGLKAGSGIYFYICTYSDLTLNGREEIVLNSPLYIIIE